MTKNAARSVEQDQRPTWTRFLDVILRTAHVLVISVLFGGAVFKIPMAEIMLWRVLALASGAALIASEVAHDLHWPSQGRAIMVFIHVGLFGLVYLQPDLAVPCLCAALIIGMAGSHMPKRFRYWSIIHQKEIDRL
jgi:hypothetical protein